ncbi:MAG: EutN/CcmL family microcompartment protein [Bacteriovoracaceae bacterium]|nr:EutN/CcmL family microcompartment protein [Bacteriovoracaceae bacterium]
MQLGEIVGTVVATKKDPKIEGLKLQIVKLIDLNGKHTGAMVVAVDSVGAGAGEIVLVASGSSARQTPLTEGKPVDCVIMAIIDILEVSGQKRYVKS